MSNTVAIVLVIAAAITLIILLIWKNKKDKKLINPDAPDSVEETIMDQERRRDKI
ncbi:MAG: hypothetical protein ABIN67_13595 [Ferruginibacter sp.]